MTKFSDRLLDLFSLPGRWVGWLVLPLFVSVIVTVASARLGVNTLIDWPGRIPVLGARLTVNSLIDFQWYVFAILVLFGGVYALRDDRHVSVDFLHVLAPPRLQIMLRLLGDLIFLIPFCLIITYYGYFFALTAWNTGEGSPHGGLQSRWIVKACIPLAFGLLALTGVVRVITGVTALFTRRQPGQG
ncbi:MAG: TRAP transporter small permease subunit [Pararhodobacter sp.]|nr:TRAP transporter small permease subunit [Pararhodobacter sp.]